MCGICCLFASAGATAEGRRCPMDDPKLRQRMIERVSRLMHRGPDCLGVHCTADQRALLGHQRLAIVGGNADTMPDPQPTVVGPYSMAVNGEIYNHVELRKQLKQEHVWSSNPTDTEVLLHAFVEYGPHFMKNMQVNGMFALCAQNSETHQFMAARDPVGIIPLYYGRDELGDMWFASELKCLHDVCIHFEEFPPGHYYSSEDDSLTAFYNPSFWSETYLPTKKVEPADVAHQLEQAVLRHLMGDVPCAVLLSGGLDSSLVAAIAANLLKSKSQDKPESPTSSSLEHTFYAAGKSHTRDIQEGRKDKLPSFCIGLEGSPDLKAAEEVANFIGTDHHTLTFTIQEGIDVLKQVIYHLETYDVTTIRASTPMYILARKIRSKVDGFKFVLSGEGADELFGGYLYFHKAPSASEMQAELVRKVRALHQFDCLRANKSMLGWSIELRVPFLDREFMDFIMDIDPAMKMCKDETTGKPRMEKYLLRKAFEGKNLLPEKLLWRQKEQFSDGVGYGWIDGLRDYAERVVTDLQMRMAKYRFPINTPNTKEAYMYREFFAEQFPSDLAAKCVPWGPSVACSTPTALKWDTMQKYNQTDMEKHVDPSGRCVDVHEASPLDAEQ
eukprot:TRINITY_DN60709_c0_g1_i1.p1 TRINITY_DN60709_c0_g1~~TRINITY_DN60709_c0_g1_i1.p1  ORF type:complete len:614 (+),score=71.18 TRINITY_DN60709_c0_g1_i1:37-1878(+)